MADQLKGFDKHDRNVYQEMTDKYDSGKYDKALELNEKLLEKYPEHPGKSLLKVIYMCWVFSNYLTRYFDSLETIAMKALIIFSLKRKTEAFEIINAVLKKNFMNFQCWYVFGLLNKHMK